MSLSFTIKQMELFALSEQRYYDYYFLLRATAGVKKGEYWSAHDALEYARRQKTVVAFPDCLISDGSEFETFQVSVAVHVSWDVLRVSLKNMREGKCKLSGVRQNRALFISNLLKVEW